MIIETSCRVKARDFRQEWFVQRAKELAEPVNMHRKLWEYAVIAQVYEDRVVSGGKVIGFGCGTEPLPAWFAAQGARVVATDQAKLTKEWADTGQHASSLDALRKPAVCDDKRFNSLVEFRPIDMNAIPVDVRDGSYDLTWSSGSLEHLGSAGHGMWFLFNALQTLKPGGVAVHTTELNPLNYGPTINEPNLALYRERDLMELSLILASQGHQLLRLDLEPGSDSEDHIIDTDKTMDGKGWGLPHLNIQIGDCVTTSVALVVIKGDR